MELLQCNCSFLRSATRALTLAYDEVLRPSGLRMTQFFHAFTGIGSR